MRGPGDRVSKGSAHRVSSSGKGSYGSGAAVNVRSNARSATAASGGRGLSRLSGKGSMRP